MKSENTEKKVWTRPIIKKMDIEETATGGAGVSDGLDPGS